MNRHTAKNSLLLGAAILGISNLIVKIIGAFFKIPLQNVLGDQGMAYFNMAYQIYSFMLAISTAGLPVALSKMVAESHALNRDTEVRRIYRVAMTTFIIIGLTGLSVILLFPRQIAAFSGVPGSYESLLVIAPSVLFVCMMSAYRGYYQGHSNMLPTAVSQILEALCKLVLGMGFALYLRSRGYDLVVVAAGAIAGVTVGTLVGMLFLFVRKHFIRKTPPSQGERKDALPYGKIFSKLLRIAVPITISAAVMSLTNTIDAFLVSNRLQSGAGLGVNAAETAYGAYTGQAITMFNLPSTLVVAITMSIIPAISGQLARNNRNAAKKTIESALRATAIIALPAAAGFISLAQPILTMLFKQSKVATGPMLQTLGIGVIFVSLVLVTNAVFQSLGRVNIPLFTMFCGGVAKIVTNYVLVGNPDIGIYGAPIGTVVCYGLIAVLNFIFLAVRVNVVPNFGKVFVKPLLASVVIGAAAFLVQDLLAKAGVGRLATITAIAVAAVLYTVLLVTLRIITREDVQMLPKGKISEFLLRFVR